MEVPLLQKRTPCLPLFFSQRETEECVPTWTEPFLPVHVREGNNH